MHLTYTEEKFKPNLIIDLATLTGAIIVALDQNMQVCGQIMRNYLSNYRSWRTSRRKSMENAST